MMIKATDASASTLSNAIANYDAYVLKSQREGGGNNIYGKEIASVLESK